MLHTRKPQKRLIGTEPAVAEMALNHLPMSLATALATDGRAVYIGEGEVTIVVPTAEGVDFTGYGYRIETYHSWALDCAPWWVVEAPSLGAVDRWMFENDHWYCGLAWYERSQLHV